MAKRLENHKKGMVRREEANLKMVNGLSRQASQPMSLS
jgi:hypothetical protein